MHIYIRADMNDTIATGHIMRCLSIADGIRKAASERAGNIGETISVIFICASGDARQMITDRGYEVVILDTDYREMESELELLKGIFASRQELHGENTDKKPLVLVDSYFVTEKYLIELGRLAHVAYLDDVAAFDYPVELLINYANYADELYENSYNMLLGPSYAPLREMFSNCPQKPIKSEVKNILIMSGGSDPHNMLAALLEAGLRNIPAWVRESDDMALKVHLTIICGRFYPDFDALLEKAKLLQSESSDESIEVCIIKSVDNMRDYLEDADLCICAGGSTLYELCAVGTPAISFSMADNQLRNVKRFDCDGIIPYAGDARSGEVANRAFEIAKKMSAENRKDISMKMQQLVDGNGAKRLGVALLDFGLKSGAN